ncbi:MAG TPA: M23 family metallopeptidase [Anaerolineae bacterium]|nr:M23 family metallopeptidase [Anaerolineae bacterium]
MIKRLCLFLGAALLPFLVAATAQSEAWQTFRDATAGFAFDYPAGAHVSVEQEASPGFASAFVSLPDDGTGYQGYAVTVFANPDDLPLSRFLVERRGFASYGGQNLRINEVSALRAARDTALAGDDAEAYWLEGDGVVMRLSLYAGHDRSIGPSKAAHEAFDRAVASFHLIPREVVIPITPTLEALSAAVPPAAATPLPDRPELTDEFISPYGVISTTSAYDMQWNIITNDTRYGVRNLSLPDDYRRCWGVAWDRMLHSGFDLYRLDGQDAAGTSVVAVADGTVAYYDPNYASYPGRVVILAHPLSDGRTIYSMYAHLGSVSVTQGQVIVRGQPIGTILYQAGDSHLHFEMRWFLDGSWIYPSYTSCNGIVYGRGYTYLTHPDDFPALNQGYVDPDAFIQARGGPPLTPIGLPDPRGLLLSVPVQSNDVSVLTEIVGYASKPAAAQPAPFDLGGPETGDAPGAIKIPPLLTATDTITAPLLFNAASTIASPVPGIVNTETLTYTSYLPLVLRNFPKQEPACVEGQELLSNGGFESGPGSAPWVQVKNGASDLIGNTQPYTGQYGLWLGGRNTADEEVLQSFVVPYYTDALTLTFKRLLTTQETEPTVYDHFEFVLENQVGNEVSPQVMLSNLSPNRNVWAAETAVFSGWQNWGNRRLRLSIKGMTDGNLLTSLFVDDVSVQTRCSP